MTQKINADEMVVSTAYPQGVIPRQTKYGDAPGLVPVGDYPDMLVDPKDYEEVIAHSHKHKMFPMYHQKHTWAPNDFVWSQNGLGYCWTWSGTAAVMDCRAREGKDTVLLAPVSLGWLVNWRNKGNYLESFIRGAAERGIAPSSYIPDQHSRNHRGYKDGWEDAALNYRIAPEGAWDTDPRTMLQHALSVLCTGTPGYIAYNWWGHALECVGLIWDESQVNNVRWVIRNSHGEDDFIEMTGRRGVPDEFFGIHSTITI